MSPLERIKCSTYNNDLARVERVRRRLSSDTILNDIAELLSSLGHPVRIKIVHALCLEPLCVCELANLLGMSSPAVMHHIRTLGDAGVIEAERQGKFAVYRVRDARARSLVLVDEMDPQLVGATL